MIPVICFYENDKFLVSQNYELIECEEWVSPTVFFKNIEHNYFDKMKIVQVNFDAYHETQNITEPETMQRELYPSSKASVFILHNYEVVTFTQVLEKFNSKKIELPPYQLLTTKKKFTNDVKQIKEMIGVGRFYQMNLTSALQSEGYVDPLNIFVNYAESYSGQYKAFLPFANHSIVSFSPELFLEKKYSVLKTSPIKGSISKNENTENDLLKNKKEAAELSMIVDLLRNDLNSLEEKSAKVVSHRKVMDLNYIQHTYSEIQIKTEQTLPTILEKMMPGGSISGCPKKESLLAIAEIETHLRGAYTGTIGFWTKNDFTLNIAIRTFVQTKNRGFYFAGCGIVYDSDPEKEFQELLNKTGRLNVRYE